MPALGHRAYLGLVKESSWGTPVLSGFAFGEFVSESLQKTIQEFVVDHINTSRSFKKRLQGKVDITGNFSTYLNPEDLTGLVLRSCVWGQQATVQVASMVVDATNNKLDFDIGGGELTATIAFGTYAPGANELTAGSLCKAIYDAIVAVEGVGVYTVSFSNVTKKFTITRSSGSLSLLWLTGTNTAVSIRSLIGFSQVDDTGSLSYVSDSAVSTALFSHKFLTSDINPGGMTIEVGRDTAVFDISGAMVDSIALNASAGELLKADATWTGKDMATGTPASPSYSTANPFVFHQGVLTVDGGSADVTNFALNYVNNLKKERYVLGSKFKLQPQSGRADVSGTFTQTFEGAGAGSVFEKFVAGTPASLVLTFTGDAVGGANYKLVVTLPHVFYNGPQDANASGAGNELFQPVPFRAIFDDTLQSEVQIELVNTKGVDY